MRGRGSGRRSGRTKTDRADAASLPDVKAGPRTKSCCATPRPATAARSSSTTGATPLGWRSGCAAGAATPSWRRTSSRRPRTGRPYWTTRGPASPPSCPIGRPAYPKGTRWREARVLVAAGPAARWAWLAASVHPGWRVAPRARPQRGGAGCDHARRTDRRRRHRLRVAGAVAARQPRSHPAHAGHRFPDRRRAGRRGRRVRLAGRRRRRDRTSGRRWRPWHPCSRPCSRPAARPARTRSSSERRPSLGGGSGCFT